MSFDRLIARIDELKNPSVAGLDPKLEYVPRFLKDAFFVKDGHTLKAAAGAILAFNKALIDELVTLFLQSNRRQPIMRCMAGKVCGHWQKPFVMHSKRACML